jgi:hypothetical protein
LQTTYFAALGLECLPEYNPADFFLDVVSMDYRTAEAEAECRERVRLLAEVYAQSPGSKHVRAGPGYRVLAARRGSRAQRRSEVLPRREGAQ